MPDKTTAEKIAAPVEMYRFKTIFWDRLRTRATKNQFKEFLLKFAVLNRMTRLGMPESFVFAG